MWWLKENATWKENFSLTIKKSPQTGVNNLLCDVACLVKAQLGPVLCVLWRVQVILHMRVTASQWRKEVKLAEQRTSITSVTMSHRQRALLALVLLLRRVAVAEYSTKTELDYEFGDYRGKWCIDDHGFVYGIGEVYYPSPSACPCTCTVDGPVCVRPKCPRIHPRCTRIRYRACCPVCEAMARVCVYGGKTYRLLEEFRVRDLGPSAALYKLTLALRPSCALL